MNRSTLDIISAPHLKQAITTDKIMFHVVLALLPVVLFSIYAFGINAFFVVASTTLTCVLTEHLLSKKANSITTVDDWSAVITGLLLGLTLPPSFPIWMCIIGGVVSIGVGKFLFGGLGYNVFNPALVGRAFLQAAFPVAISTWTPSFLPNSFTDISASIFTLPLMKPEVDAVTSATPLALQKFGGVFTESTDLAMGLISGSTGETCSILILLGGLYLIWRKMMNWRIPVAVLGSAFVLSGILYAIDPYNNPSPTFTLFAGVFMLCAVFMATDMVASPLTPLGVWIYGSFIGVLVVVIRVWGGLPEGVMYAILLANALSPHISSWTKTRVYGMTNKKKAP